MLVAGINTRAKLTGLFTMYTPKLDQNQYKATLKPSFQTSFTNLGM